MWRIYYDDGSVVEGNNAQEWGAAPSTGVQVVVALSPVSGSAWSYRKHGKNEAVTDRKLWTGQDEYDPFHWGVKTGSWMNHKDYMDIWDRACGDN